MRCSFCATGKGGFARNLAPHEIIDQAMTVQEQFGRRVSNVGAETSTFLTVFHGGKQAACVALAAVGHHRARVQR